METLDPNAYLTLEELCEEVNRLGRDHKLVAKGEDITGRTVRFYIEKDLLPSARPGPGKKYPYATVWRVLFIRLLSTKHGMPLDYLRGAMQSVDAATMRRVVTGEEPLEVLAAPDDGAVRRHRERGYQVKALSPVRARGGSGAGWMSLAQTEDVILQVREGLAPGKLKQLRHIAALIRALHEDV